MLVAIHQPNFMPWFPFFEKMHLCDRFVIMRHCQFEKGGWQNRCHVNGKYWTMQIKHGLELIIDKECADGANLSDLNTYIIMTIARLLGIDTYKIRFDAPTEVKGSERIVEILNKNGATHYLTNPDALDKYLDANLIPYQIIPFQSDYKMHTFEMFDKYGIEGTRKILQHEKEAFDALYNRETARDDGNSRTSSRETVQA